MPNAGPSALRHLSTSGSNGFCQKGSCPILVHQHYDNISTSGSKGFCQKLVHQQYDNLHGRLTTMNDKFKGSCLMPTQRHYDNLNSQMTTNFCMSHAPTRRTFVIIQRLRSWADRSHTHTYIALIVCLNLTMALISVEN